MGDAETIEWEDVACMLCGAAEGRPAGSVEWRGNDLAYKICTGCGLKYMAPRPTESWYRGFYEREFWEDKFENRSWRSNAAGWMPWHWFRSGLGGRLRKGRKRAKVVAPLIAEHAGLARGARVLDIGCAFGLILERLKQDYGCEPYGIEPSRTAREYAASTTGVTFVGTSAEDLAGIAGKDSFFDLVILSNVLENIVAPGPVLEACRRVLAPTGVLYVETPNFFYYDAMNPYHPYIYSEATLTALLARSGLEVVTTLSKAPVGSQDGAGRIERNSRRKFVTVFARPAEPSSPSVHSVDVDRLIEMQRDSLAAGTA